MDIKKVRMLAISRKDSTMKFVYKNKYESDDKLRSGEFVDAYTGQVKMDPDEKLLRGKTIQSVEALHDDFGNFFKYFMIDNE